MLNERVSAWCDGELNREEGERVLAELLRDEALRSECELSWMLGDALRGEPALGADFTKRVMAALKTEPVVFVPSAIPKRSVSHGLRHGLSIAAGVAGVVVAAWVVHAVWSSWLPESRALVAESQKREVLVPKAGGADAPIRLASDKAYLMAHQASTGGGAPMAGVVHFIRTVSDDQQDFDE